MAPKLNPNRTPFTPLHLCLFLLLVIITTISTLSLSSPSSYHSLFLALSSNYSASTHLRHLTVRPHIASSPENSLAASYVLSSLPFPSHSVFYSVLLSFPLFRSLFLSSPHINFPLTQIPIPSDPSPAFSSLATPTYLAYSASNSVSSPVVYANYGRVEDFQHLLSLKVNITGTIILARYGQIYRGDIVKNAQDFGAVGVVIYSDPKDYNKDGETFPDGPGLPETGVQVGSTFRGLGDPLTPGWTCAANENEDECERVKTEEVVKQGLMVRIPALPVSGKDGEEIHRAIGGQVAPDDWQGRDDAPVYRVGPGPGVLNLTYIGNDTLRTIQNVFGVIEGKEEPDRYVLLGNHRDAWTFGAVDPNSGTAALLELAERLSKLQKRGWKPRRTIILCNWDAEEFGLIGSTEWVEENREMLSSRAVAYLNVDSSVCGPKFYASATPQLDHLIIHASRMVKDPDNSSQTVYDSWVSSTGSPPIGRLGGGGSDFAAFVQHIGVPSVDMSFGDGYIGYPVYHSLYDDYLWMEKFGDPFFQRHIAAASIWGLIALRLADDEILPFDYVSYASALKSSTEEIEKEAIGNPVNFTPLYRSIQLLNKSALKIIGAKKDLERKVWGINLRKNQAKVRDLNDRLIMAERAFTDRDGLSGREWYKHLIYGPTKNNDYGSKSFPGIDDAIELAKKINTTESWRFVQHEIYSVARAIKQASLVLNGGLT